MAGRTQNAARTNTNRRQTSYSRTDYGRTDYGRTEYVQGSAVRKPDVQRQMQEPPRKKLSNSTRKNRDKAFYMNLPYVAFLATALLIMGVVLVGYIRVQAEITSTVKNISKLESTLNDLKLENDEAYSRITSSVDLEEIRKIAIGELGMHYAEEGQVINYSIDGSDYVRQFADIPE